MDDAYAILKAHKAPGESFSDEIRRLVQEKGSILDLAGAWKNITDEEAEKMKKAIREMRKGNRFEELKKRMASA